MSGLHAERDRLEHQRWRIQDILGHRMVSPDMESHLRTRLKSITQRLTELDGVSANTALAPLHATQQQQPAQV